MRDGKSWIRPQSRRGVVFGIGELAIGGVVGCCEHPEPQLFFVLEGGTRARGRYPNGTEYETLPRAGKAFLKEGGVLHQMVNIADGDQDQRFFCESRAASYPAADLVGRVAATRMERVLVDCPMVKASLASMVGEPWAAWSGDR